MKFIDEDIVVGAILGILLGFSFLYGWVCAGLPLHIVIINRFLSFYWVFLYIHYDQRRSSTA